MSSQPRKLEVKYGSITVGGSSAILLHNFTESLSNFTNSSFSFTAVVLSTSGADFASKCKSLEENFRKPDQDLEVRCNGSVLISYKQSDNTGFDCLPTITRSSNIINTGYSRAYNVNLAFGRPATWERAGYTGLRSKVVSLSYDESRRRTVSINGEFTAVRDNDASEQYDAKLQQLITDTLTYIEPDATVFWDKLNEDINYTTNNKTCTFAITFREVLYDQGTGGKDNDNIINQTLIINKSLDTSPNSPDFVNPTTLSVSYSASVDYTKKKGTQLKTLWEDDLRDWVLEEAKKFSGSGGDFYMANETININVDSNTISAKMTLIQYLSESATTGGDDGTAISQTIETSDSTEEGLVVLPVADGNPISRYVFAGPKTVKRTITRSTRLLGANKDTNVNKSDLEKKPDNENGGEWIKLGESKNKTPLRVGVGKDVLDMTEVTHSITQQYIKKISAKGTTGGNVGSATTPSGGSATTGSGGGAGGAGGGAGTGTATTGGS